MMPVDLICLEWEPLTTADVTTANVTTADVLVLGVWVWVRGMG